MKHLLTLILCVLLFELCYAAVYTDTWAVHIEGGDERAVELAEKHGFQYLGKIMNDIYHLRHSHVSKRSIHPNSHHHDTLAQEPQVKWLEQQIVKKRVKRDNLFNDPMWPRMWYLDRDAVPIYHLRSSSNHHQVGNPSFPSAQSRSRRGGGVDMNVKSAWRKGYTGKNVVVSILDDGIEKNHPDLKKNYDPGASYDVNGHDPDPQPRYDYTNENRHGTRCAGEVAAEANNGICSVGIAYNARIGGVRMLDGDVTDAVEAQSLSLNPQHIDIYSASWGPDDDGRTVDGPAILAKRAFLDGITKGRGGKGSIFVWASGNGGRDGDSCNCDGYTNSIYTLSISSATENGNIPWYSEACSSTLATTYSSGSGGERQIVTTDLRKGCTETHTGTSASAPLAAGICALALQSKMDMTWRDMQHIVVMTARLGNLKASDWVTNGVGRRVSHSFGYGLMDATAMVELGRNWTNVPKQHKCQIKYTGPARTIPLRSKIQVYLDSDGCQFSLKNKVIYLEHVQAYITLSSSRRGEVRIFLTSPHGTKSTLLQRRARDTSTEGFSNWAFMTTHNWGETSKGRWTLTIENGDSRSHLQAWSLVMYGTATHPQTGVQHQPGQAGHSKAPGCKEGEYLLHDFCYEKCPLSFYASSRNVTAHVGMENNDTTALPKAVHVLVCDQCHVECTECFGPAHNECLACANGFIFDVDDFLCERQDTGPGVYSQRAVIWLPIVIVIGILFALAASIGTFLFLQARDNGYVCKRNHIKYVDLGKNRFGAINKYTGIQLGPQKISLLASESDDSGDEGVYLQGAEDGFSQRLGDQPEIDNTF